jgi:hypothetical protein
MNTITSWIGYWNRKVRKLTIIDLKLIQVTSMAGILIIVKLFPEVLNLSIWWFAALLVICILRPAYVIWIRDDEIGQRAA